MEHGGKREGAGRKRGSSNLLTQELRDIIKASQIIRFLQDLALGKIEGASLGERKEAATALLKKVLPDVNAQKIETESHEPIIIKLSPDEMKL